MRVLLAAVVLLAGCESMSQKVDASRQQRCQKADWAMVGERDGVETGQSYADRYSNICGDLYNDAAYKQGYSKGAARRPRPPV